MLRSLWLYVALCSTFFSIPAIASAHAFGQQFNLPLPVNFYILGGCCAFIASVAVILLFSNPIEVDKPFEIHQYSLNKRVPNALRNLGLFAYVLAIVLAIAGSNDPITNPLVGLFWIVFLLLFTYLTAVIDGLWLFINPFRVLTSFLKDETPKFDISKAKAKYAPSIVLFCILIWLELFSNGQGTIPLLLGIILLVYTILCCIGVFVYGWDGWFQYGELFSVFFNMVGKIASVRITETKLEISSVFDRLVFDRPDDISLIYFLLCVLASTAIDGIRDTAPWLVLMLDYLPRVGLVLTSNTLGLLALIILPAVFLSLYALSVYLMKVLSRSEKSTQSLMLSFGYSLIPIAVAYNFAHYFSLVLVTAQTLIPQFSDPLAHGWNLFGTANYQPNLIPIGADKIWYIQLGTIVIGHVIAALVAHRIAARIFKTKRHMIISQLPILVLMVFYTAFGLWILSQAFVPVSI